MKRTSPVLLVLAFASSLLGAGVTEDIRVNRIPKKRPSAQQPSRRPRRPGSFAPRFSPWCHHGLRKYAIVPRLREPSRKEPTPK